MGIIPRIPRFLFLSPKDWPNPLNGMFGSQFHAKIHTVTVQRIAQSFGLQEQVKTSIFNPKDFFALHNHFWAISNLWPGS